MTDPCRVPGRRPGRRPALLLAAALLTTAGCGSPATPAEDPEPAASSGASDADPTPGGTTGPDTDPESDSTGTVEEDDAPAAAVVADPQSQLSGLRVAREGEELTVTTIWVAGDGGTDDPDAPGTVMARSDDGFRTVRYQTGGPRRLFERVAPPRPWGIPRFVTCGEIQGGADLCRRASGEGWQWSPDYGLTWSRLPEPMPDLATDPVTSLTFGTLALVGGGDGATLLPFERLARTTTEQESWQVVEVPRFGGARAYTAGQVVLEDGRLVALLDSFSDDRPGRPSPRHHGLWASDGGDWTSYEPLEPTLAADQQQAPRGRSTVTVLGASAAPDPVVWLQTWDGRVYVSSDDARTFREVRVRP